MQNYGYRHQFGWVEVFKATILGALVFFVVEGSNAVAQEAKNEPAPLQTTTKNDEIEQLRKSVRQLSAEVARLKAENAKLEKYQQVDYLRGQLTKEEQRVESLQKELTDMSARETSLQKRLDEIEPQLQPGQIEQSRAGIGSLRPEEDREAVQRQLLNEKRRIQTQLDLFQQNRVRIQNAISSAEASTASLRLRLRDAMRAAHVSP